MNLTKEQFSLLSEQAQKHLIESRAIRFLRRNLNENFDTQFCLLFGFYLEIISDQSKNNIQKINLAVIHPSKSYFVAE